MQSFHVEKRSGEIQPMDLNKVTIRLQRVKNDAEAFYRELNPSFTAFSVDVQRIVDQMARRVYDGITTSEIDEQCAIISSHVVDHPDYFLFGGIILASNLESNNRDVLSFSSYAKKAYKFVDESTGVKAPLISEELYKFALQYGHIIDRHIDLRRNWLFDYASMSTLVKGQYLLSTYKQIQEKEDNQSHGVKRRAMVAFETPQHMFMRCVLHICKYNWEEALQTYQMVSLKQASLPTPTLFHAGTPKPSLISCFLLHVPDSVEGIFEKLKESALISKGAGGVGLHFHSVRGKGAYIAGTNGKSNGIMPAMKVYESVALYIDQGGGKRKGSFAVYLELWHPDIEDFLRMKRPDTPASDRLPDLFNAIWVNDLFMERVKEQLRIGGNSVMWSLFDPSQHKELPELYGEDFTRKYLQLEQDKTYVRQIPIIHIMQWIAEACLETGTPYLLSKDNINRKSNQKNLGTIRSSNLCAEIVQFSNFNETACCNLGSIVLSSFVCEGTYDFQKLYHVVRRMIRVLNNVIDINHYPSEPARRSNLRHRPIGLGIAGLADTFALMRYPAESDSARRLNLQIAETMNFAALEESHTLAVQFGPYESLYENGGAPISKGLFQWDLANQFDQSGEKCVPDATLAWNWDGLREKVVRDGVRNSLLIALMPTASTSIIAGVNDSFEMFHSNQSVRKTKSGEFIQINRYMVKHLQELGLWSIDMLEKIKANGGKVTGIKDIPEDVQAIYKTVSEIPLKTLTLLARDRGYYVCQSQSLNVTVDGTDPSSIPIKLWKYWTYAHKLGMKTLSYYVRVVRDSKYLKKIGSTMTNAEEQKEPIACPRRAPGDTSEQCLACQS